MPKPLIELAILILKCYCNENIHIPTSKYAVFTPEKPLNPVEYSSLVSFAYGEWLPMSGYKLYGDFTFDEYYIEAGMKVYLHIV